jgi:molybdopterin converting factor small subunit
VNVEVRLFATFAAFLPSEARVAGATTVELPDRSTVADVAAALGIPGGMSRVALVNGHEAVEGHRLAAGDVVTLFPPLAGGSTRRAGRQRLLDQSPR